MRVLKHESGTWRARTHPATLTVRLDTHGRAIRTYRAATDAHLPQIAALGFTTRFKKARCGTQTPPALARVLEELVDLHCAGASADELRLFALAIEELISDLIGPTFSEDQVLTAIRAAQIVDADEDLAECALLTRADRRLDPDALLAVASRKRAAAASEFEAARLCEGYAHQLRRDAMGLRRRPRIAS